MSFSSFFCYLLVLGLFASAAARTNLKNLETEIDDLREHDRVVNLPGQPQVEFRHYAGYVAVDEDHGKKLFYWFFEAFHEPTKKPLLLWLNGGPGCSSIGYGEAQELGPFLVNKRVPKITFNKNAWNKAANLLFLDAPAGVGFSYSNSDHDVYGDDQTAMNSYTFLINWLRRFPHYRTNEFYIAGESYAGHYVPQLAEKIHDENNKKRATREDYINLKGIMIGNAVMDHESDLKGMVEYAWSHAILSDREYESIINNCNFSEHARSEECGDAMIAYYAKYGLIDMYSIYSPTCEEASTVSSASPVRRSNANFTSFVVQGRWLEVPGGYDPCEETYATTFFNRADVQEALHANVTKIARPWSLCSYDIFRNWTESSFSVLPTISKLIKGGVRVWIYSGDTDGRVPVTFTKYALNKLGLKIKEEWTPWYNHKQVGGWTVIYEGLTFVTVRGAGHQVPTFAPKQSLELVKHFLSNEKLPSMPF